MFEISCAHVCNVNHTNNCLSSLKKIASLFWKFLYPTLTHLYLHDMYKIYNI